MIILIIYIHRIKYPFEFLISCAKLNLNLQTPNFNQIKFNRNF